MDYVLYHHGIKGQKWGIRRYQNKDGSLTPAGKKRLENYKTKELERVEAKYQVEKLAARRDKFEEDFIKDYDTRALNKLTKARYRHLKAQTMEFIEKRKIESMTFDDMQSERAEIRKMQAKQFLSEFEGMILGRFTDVDVAKTNMRVGLDESIYSEYEARKKTGYNGL